MALGAEMHTEMICNYRWSEGPAAGADGLCHLALLQHFGLFLLDRCILWKTCSTSMTSLRISVYVRKLHKEQCTA